jgi:short-subunit dehydrogenase
MDLGLVGKTVLLTGASKGIGYAAARLFAQEGATVVICARRSDALVEAAETIAQETGRAVDHMPGRRDEGC